MRLWLAVALLGLASALPARAQDVPVSAQLDPCVPVDRAQFARLLAIELGTSGVDAAAAGGAGTEVTVSCDGERLVLSLQDGVTRKSMRRALPAAPLRGSAAANTTRATRACTMAPAHIGQGSRVTYRVVPGRR